MAIQVIGVTGSMDVTEFSRLMRRVMNAQQDEEVATGLAVSPATGTRLLSVSAGESVQAGTLFVMDAAQTVTLAANTSGLPRIDLVCAQVDWLVGTTPTTEATAGSIAVIQGTPAATPVAPTLTSGSHSPGSLWRTALAKVTVPNGATQLAAANVVDARNLTNSSAYTSATIAPPGAWSVPTASPWKVERYGDTVFMSGRLTRLTAAIDAGTEAVFGGAQLIPTGYRPASVVSAALLPDSGSGILGHMTILTDGTVTYSQNFGSFPVNGTLRIVSTSWRTND